MTYSDVGCILFAMEQELKRKNFKRIAEARVTRALDLIDLIGNLSNTSFYEYDYKDIEKIFDTLEKSLKSNKEKFNKDIHKEKRRFVL